MDGGEKYENIKNSFVCFALHATMSNVSETEKFSFCAESEQGKNITQPNNLSQAEHEKTIVVVAQAPNKNLAQNEHKKVMN